MRSPDPYPGASTAIRADQIQDEPILADFCSSQAAHSGLKYGRWGLMNDALMWSLVVVSFMVLFTLLLILMGTAESLEDAIIRGSVMALLMFVLVAVIGVSIWAVAQLWE